MATSNARCLPPHEHSLDVFALPELDGKPSQIVDRMAFFNVCLLCRTRELTGMELHEHLTSEEHARKLEALQQRKEELKEYRRLEREGANFSKMKTMERELQDLGDLEETIAIKKKVRERVLKRQAEEAEVLPIDPIETLGDESDFDDAWKVASRQNEVDYNAAMQKRHRENKLRERRLQVEETTRKHREKVRQQQIRDFFDSVAGTFKKVLSCTNPCDSGHASTTTRNPCMSLQDFLVVGPQ